MGKKNRLCLVMFVYFFTCLSWGDVTITSSNTFEYYDDNEKIKYEIRLSSYTDPDNVGARHNQIRQKKLSQFSGVEERRDIEGDDEDKSISGSPAIAEVKVVEVMGNAAFIIRTVDGRYFFRFPIVYNELNVTARDRTAHFNLGGARLSHSSESLYMGPTYNKAVADSFLSAKLLQAGLTFAGGEVYCERQTIRNFFWYTIPITLGDTWNPEEHRINIPRFAPVIYKAAQ